MTLRFVVDTDVISETSRSVPDGNVVRWLLAIDRIAITSVTIYELARGVEKAPSGKRRRFLVAWLARLLSTPMTVLPFDRDAALTAARLEAQARRGGKGVDAHDLFIAASASTHNLAIATRNVGHFRGLGVSVFDPFTGSWSI